MDHPDDFIEAFAVDGQATVPSIGKGADQVIEADVAGDRHDVAAGDANVAGGLLAEMQQVAQHLPFGGCQVAGDGM